MASPKEMLSALIQRGQLKPREKEAFEGMWDSVHRYGRLTPKQKAWVEKEFYGQELDRSTRRPKSGTFVGAKVRAKKAHRIGYINYSGTRDLLLITNIEMLKDLCPSIKPGSKQYQKIEAFFRKGGEVLKIKPVIDKSA